MKSDNVTVKGDNLTVNMLTVCQLVLSTLTLGRHTGERVLLLFARAFARRLLPAPGMVSLSAAEVSITVIG